MAEAGWGISPLGNLAQFESPQFRTGEGLGAIMTLRQRQREQVQDSFMDLAQQMQKRKQDEIANTLADKMAGAYGVTLPEKTGAFGEGGLRLKMVKDLFEAQEDVRGRRVPTKVGDQELNLTPGEAATALRPRPSATTYPTMIDGRLVNLPAGSVGPEMERQRKAREGDGGQSIAKSVEKGIKKQLYELGTTPEEFGADIQVPGKVTYWAPDFSKQISTEEARKDPKAQAVLPGGASMSVVEYGKLGQKYRNIATSQRKTGGGTTQIPQAAIDALKGNPERAAEFDNKYGAGSAAIILGQ